MSQVSYSRLAFLLLAVFSVFFVGLGSARLWDRDEPRNSRASHEMLERGDWIVPTFNGSLRDHKPILLYWGQMISYAVLGESDFTARLPSALCALLTIAAVAVLASRLAGKPQGISQEGFWGAACLATCGLFVMAGRAATPDACLIAFSTLGIAALVIAALVPSHPYSSGQVGRARWIPAMFGYTMLGLAVLAKGPVGIVLPLIVVHVWWLICRRWQSQVDTPDLARPATWLLWLRLQIAEVWCAFNPWQCLRAVIALRTFPGVLLSLLAAAPWYAAVGIETRGAFLRGFFLEHNVGRALGAMEGHNGSLLFYPLAFLVGTFPWSMWLIPVVMWCRGAMRENVLQRQMIVLAAVWIGVYIVAFSAASTKLPSYITPCYAGAALILGAYWRQFETAWSRPTLRLRRLAYGLTICVGVAITVAIVGLSKLESMPLLSRAAVAGVVVIFVGVVGFWWEFRARTHRLPLTWFAGAAAFQIILFGLGTKSVDLYRQDLAMLAQVSQADGASAATETNWLAIGGMEPSWVYYLKHEIVEVVAHESDPQAWEQVTKFLAQHPAGRIVVVGDEAHQHFVAWRQQRGGPAFTELANASRFLKPGRIRVLEQATAQVSTVASRANNDSVVR